MSEPAVELPADNAPLARAAEDARRGVAAHLTSAEDLSSCGGSHSDAVFVTDSEGRAFLIAPADYERQGYQAELGTIRTQIATLCADP